ncbi:hypothetical protein B0T24DRAFT_564031 [Lasiosphaeria ovina]|uniref:Heterokaryon incompatibility domain-containing protein n=1 Tax=Lasiosphaeria ovina TaxID=92902 RepID=A0AAE0NIK0_9PEZI|nr:hypothetical protein B0T24DRAFT_564031 [Lasiosphaeria ovina]
MQLLNAHSLVFEEFADDSLLPGYAILSHRWEDDEVIIRRDEAETKKGFSKIRACADQALKKGLECIWVDTCCIDKSSSAKLSEAINSMFR